MLLREIISFFPPLQRTFREIMFLQVTITMHSYSLSLRLIISTILLTPHFLSSSFWMYYVYRISSTLHLFMMCSDCCQWIDKLHKIHHDVTKTYAHLHVGSNRKNPLYIVSRRALSTLAQYCFFFLLLFHHSGKISKLLLHFTVWKPLSNGIVHNKLQKSSLI